MPGGSGSGGATGAKGSAGASGSSGGGVQYAVLSVTGDVTSQITPYNADIEIDYGANSATTAKGGGCTLRYYPATSPGTNTPDMTTIICTASLPSTIDGPANGEASFPLAPTVQIEIYLKGNINPPVQIDATSPLLADLIVEVFGGHNGWEAESPSMSNPPSAFSFGITSATALSTASPTLWTDYLLDAQGYATTGPVGSGGPGLATVSFVMSTAKVAGFGAGGASGTEGATNGTCADLVACCSAMGNTVAGATCGAQATAYQGMVGGALSQQQADVDCDNVLHLERAAGLCP